MKKEKLRYAKTLVFIYEGHILELEKDKKKRAKLKKQKEKAERHALVQLVGMSPVTIS